MSRTTDPKPAAPSPFLAVHLPGFPCGARFGRYGTGWGAITCPTCTEIANRTPKES